MRSRCRPGRPSIPWIRRWAECTTASWRPNYRQPREWFSFEQAWSSLSPGGKKLTRDGPCNRCGPDDVLQHPPFALAQRPALHDAHHIAFLRLAMLVVRHEFGPFGHSPLIDGMRHTSSDFHHDGLLHFCAGHDADFLLAVSRLL